MKSNNNLLPATPRDTRSAARPPILISILTASIATLLGVAPLHAQDKWTGATDNVWTTGGNWFDTTAPALATDVQFFGGYDAGGTGYADPTNGLSTFDVTNVTPTLNLATATTAHTGSILIDSLTSYTFAAGTGQFTPASGKSITVVIGSHTINELIRYDSTAGGTNFDIQPPIPFPSSILAPKR